MRGNPPAIADFPSFEAELRDALARAEAFLEAHPGDPGMEMIQRQLLDVRSYSAGGRCPSDAEIARTTFGHYASHELRDHPALARLLSRLDDYIHQWPPGVDAPSWR
jgi:hypothetical protein